MHGRVANSVVSDIVKRASSALALAVVAVVAAAAGPQGAAEDLRARITAARTLLIAHFKEADARSKMAAALQARLDGDAAELDEGFKPSTMTSEDFWWGNAVRVQLDTSLVDQLASGKLRDPAAVRGADELLVKADDGTLQPVGVYVPSSYDPKVAAALVVFLHGRTLTESDTLAVPFLLKLAGGGGVILIAPFARGDQQYADPAPRDVYLALDMAERAYNVDRHRVYLAGYSMGATGAFRIGAMQPSRWAGFLVIAGYLLKADSDAVLKAFSGKALYVVDGAIDTVAPVEFVRATVRALKEAGLQVHYYEEPGGGHSLGSLYSSFARAWNELLGVTPSPSTRLVTQPPVAPSASPAATQPFATPIAGVSPKHP